MLWIAVLFSGNEFTLKLKFNWERSKLPVSMVNGQKLSFPYCATSGKWVRKTLTMSANFWVMRGRQASNDPKICKNDEFFPRIFKSRKVGNDICFIMTFFRIPVRKTSGENSHWNEENTVKMIQWFIYKQSFKTAVENITGVWREKFKRWSRPE